MAHIETRVITLALELRPPLLLSGTRERRGEAAVIAVTRLLHGRNGGGHYWEHTRRETAKR